MLSLRARLFTIISLAVFVILAISVFLLIQSKKSPSTPVGTTDNNLATADSINQLNNIAPANIAPTAKFVPATSEETEKNAVQQFAKIFIERLNSYSSDSNFKNIYEVKTLVTPDLWKELNTKIDNNAGKGNYLSRSTKVLSTSLAKFNAKEAQVQLQAKVSDSQSGQVSTKDRDITVNLVKQGDNWLVNNYTW